MIAPATIDQARVDGIELLRKDGTRKLVNLSVSALLNVGLATGVVLTAEDVTDRVLLEQQLRQSQKLEAVGQLAGGIAHDFNNLLTGIIGYSELLLADTAPSDPAHEPLEIIKRTGEQAASLTRQLLAFSRKQVLQPKVLDLNEIVRDSHRLLARLLGANIDLTAVLKQPLGAVQADPAQVEQVIMNLVLNARDALPDGGEITIETAEVDSDQLAAPHEHVQIVPGPYVVLTVSDTGAGIDPAVRDRIFEPFFTTKALGTGTGLGLSTVYGIVKQSGGYITVESAPGRGATFHVYLPRVSSRPERPSGRGAAGTRGGETVLLVEDADIVRDIARAALEASGYTVLEAEDGLAALELFAELADTIDLVLTDVVMPRMGGRELAARLRELHPDVRVVFTSGYTDDVLLREDLSADETFLQKPFSAAELTSLVRRVLDASAPAAAVRIR